MWEITKLQIFEIIKTVNTEGYQFAIVFPVTRENWEWWDFGFYQDWRNQDLTLKDLPISHEIILT